MKNVKKYALWLAAAFALFALAAGGVLCVWGAEISELLRAAGAFFSEKLAVLDGVPLICYSLVIFALPIFFLPVTPVFFIAAARVGEFPIWEIVFFCCLGVTLNIAFSYYISRKFGAFLRRKLDARGVSVPRLPEKHQYAFVFLMRLIPGNPLAAQNYVLGLAEVPFFKYAVVSLPIQYLQIFGYVYLGDGFLTGGLGKIVAVVACFAVLAVFARILDKKYGHKFRRKSDGLPAAKR